MGLLQLVARARAMAAPSLKNSLSDLASQLSKIQDENDTIRQRYLELEDAWQKLGVECRELRSENADLKADNAAKTAALEKANALVASLEHKLGDTHAAFVEQRNLAEETKTTLISEQLQLGRKTKETEILRREAVQQEAELRKLREAWNEREARVARLEEQRNFYEQQLSQLGESYQALVDRMGFVAADYGVATMPVAAPGAAPKSPTSSIENKEKTGDPEMLSSYLGRVFDDPALAYSRPHMSPHHMSPYGGYPFPMNITPRGSPVRS